jgi:hypothetical protein
MSEDPTPVRDEHVAFARALVALAREHGVGFLDATFARDAEAMRDDEWNPARVTLTWREGQHGSAGRIGLRAEAVHSVSEIKESTQ